MLSCSIAARLTVVAMLTYSTSHAADCSWDCRMTFCSLSNKRGNLTGWEIHAASTRINHCPRIRWVQCLPFPY